jgi:hypothetical protein
MPYKNVVLSCLSGSKQKPPIKIGGTTKNTRRVYPPNAGFAQADPAFGGIGTFQGKGWLIINVII